VSVVVTGIEPSPLDVARLLDDFGTDDCGGLVVFEGKVRATTDGKAVLKLEYEAYERLARGQLERIARETAARFGVEAVLAVHRVGVVAVGETAIVVATAAPHRGEAFSAASELVSRIKSEAAIWKKEVFADGAVWVGCEAELSG
jgi:molybdopterin synthase catalytic subunit